MRASSIPGVWNDDSPLGEVVQSLAAGDEVLLPAEQPVVQHHRTLVDLLVLLVADVGERLVLAVLLGAAAIVVSQVVTTGSVTVGR